MKADENTTAELTFLFKLLPVMHEVESIDRVYRFLLALVTSCPSIGYRRAVVLTVDGQAGALRGRYGVERADKSRRKRPQFEEMAREVFDIFENVEQTQLTLKARTFSESLDRTESALVKAMRMTFPVLAQRGAETGEDDGLFDLLEADSYVAVPLRVGEEIRAVLAVDRGRTRKEGAEDISLLYSLAQQASEAATRLAADSEQKRRLRILWKLQKELGAAHSDEAIESAVQIGLLMIGRAVGADGCMLKDLARQKTLHVKAVQEYSTKGGDVDVAISECFDDILDRTAGRIEVVEGKARDPMLTPTLANHITSFYAAPLVSGDEVAGALAVYDELGSERELAPDQKRFIETCAGVIAGKLDVIQKNERFDRVETCLEEVTANLSREREHSRIGERSVEYHARNSEYLEEIGKLLSSRAPYAKRVPRIAELIRSMRSYGESFERMVLAPKSTYRMCDIFGLVEGVVDVWRQRTDLTDIDVTLRIQKTHPKLLVDKKRIALALASILNAIGSYLRAGDKLLVECTDKDERAHICFADTGDGLPGDTISRLFMPFEQRDDVDEKKRALSLAADVIEKHGGDVTIKSAGNWKTILILSFPLAANRDRRKTAADRRRRGDRRHPVRSTS